MRTTVLTLATSGLIVLAASAQQPDDQAPTVREIVGRGGELRWDQIARQVHFTREYVLYLHWNGVADDELSFATEQGPHIVIRFTPGGAKNKEMHDHVFAVPKQATWKLLETKKSSRTPAVVEIRSTADLERAFPGTKLAEDGAFIFPVPDH
jgi:hypothetical protein